MATNRQDFPGVYRAIVVNNNDPQKQRRLQVELSTALGNSTDWIWPMEPSNISTEVPAIGQGVWVHFQAGDHEYPVWFGSFGTHKGASKKLFLKPVPNSAMISDVPDLLIVNTKDDGTSELDVTDSLIAIAHKANVAGSGAQGVQGRQGTQGNLGPQGIQGIQGVLGVQGPVGYQGLQGIQGTQGFAGVDGDHYSTPANGSLTLANSGTASVTVTELNVDYTVGQDIIIAYDADHVQYARVISYDAGTGVLTFEKTSKLGSGTYTTWQANLAGAVGIAGAQGVQGPQGIQGLGYAQLQGTQGLLGLQGIQGITGPVGAGGTVGYYGSFYDTLSQTIATTSTGQPILLRNTDIANGISIVSNSRITFAYTGTYDMQFSFQWKHTGGAGSGTTVEVWLVKNETAVPETNTRVAVNTNSPYVVSAWDFMISATAGDYYQIYWATDNASIELTANTGAMGGPHIPSAIVTVMPVLYSIQGTQGTIGSNGTNGTNGTNGAQGVQGVQGIQGPVASPLAYNINLQSVQSYNYALGDAASVVLHSNSGVINGYIPTNAVAFPVGSSITVIQTGNGQVTIQALTPGTTTVTSNAITTNAPKLRGIGSSATFIKIATESWYVIGDLY